MALRHQGQAIDICIVATRRPDLLSQTLASFNEKLLCNFEINRFIVNIDPLFGTVVNEAECIRLVRSYDPDAIVSRPESAGFAVAVATTWAASTTGIILHLEDDWLLRRPVTQEDIRVLTDDRTIGQVSFNHANKNWSIRRKGPYCYIRRRRMLFGWSTPLKRKLPLFLTAPSFVDGAFARRAAALLDPRFDPEKQFCRGLNPALEAWVAPFQNRILGEGPDFYIQDIGRQWRESRNIGKSLVEGQSYWHVGEASPPPAG